MIFDVKGILILVLALVMALFVWRVQVKLSDYAVLKSNNKVMVDRLERLEQQAEAYDRALLERAEREQWARDVRREVMSQLDEVQRHDSDASDYLGTRIPDGVRQVWDSSRRAASGDQGIAGTDSD